MSEDKKPEGRGDHWKNFKTPPKKRRFSFLNAALMIFAIAGIVVSVLLGIQGVRKEIATEEKRNQELDDLKRKWEEEDQRSKDEGRANDLALKKVLDEMGVAPFYDNSRTYMISSYGSFRAYDEEIPKEIILFAKEIKKRMSAEVYFEIYRPGYAEDYLSDDSLRTCRIIRVFVAKSWIGYCVAIWDSKDLNKFAFGHEKMTEFLNNRKD